MYNSVFQERRKNSHPSVMVVVWVSAGNDLGLLICIFFHCRMISNALTQGEDPKNPERLKVTVTAHNLHSLSSAKSKDRAFALLTFPVATVFSARWNLQHWRSQAYCSTPKVSEDFGCTRGEEQIFWAHICHTGSWKDMDWTQWPWECLKLPPKGTATTRQIPCGHKSMWHLRPSSARDSAVLTGHQEPQSVCSGLL